MIATVEIVYRDAHLLVLNKPAGLPTTSPTGEGCLVEIAQRLDPTASRLHATSRLDAEVTGLVTFARTERATTSLLAARQAGTYARRYVALVYPALTPASGTWTEAIALDPRNPRRRLAKGGDRSKNAQTRFRTLAMSEGFGLMCLSPLTGRTHQLRVHAANAGAPIVGDKHYGAPPRITASDGRVWSARRTMLHCAALRIPHPRSGTPLTLFAPIPDDIRDLWQRVGGAMADFGTADSLLET
jgi:RluA family pseudouridine synthase